MRKKRTRMKDPSATELAEKAMLKNPAASFTECTGFVPRIPDSEPAAMSYNDIFPTAPVTALDGSEAYKKER